MIVTVHLASREFDSEVYSIIPDKDEDQLEIYFLVYDGGKEGISKPHFRLVPMNYCKLSDSDHVVYNTAPFTAPIDRSPEVDEFLKALHEEGVGKKNGNSEEDEG